MKVINGTWTIDVIDNNKKDTWLFFLYFYRLLCFFYRQNRIASFILTKIVFYRSFSKFLLFLLAR